MASKFFPLGRLGCTLCCLFAATLAVQADEEKVPLSLKNVPVAEALVQYSRLIGKQIVTDNTVQGQINVVTDGPVSKEQAARIIETAMFSNGFALVDSQDGTIVKVIGLGKLVRAESPPIYQSVDDLPGNERVVSLVVKLKHAKAQQVQGFLSQYMAPGATMGYTADPASGTLVITAPTSAVRSAVKLLDSVDVPAREEAAQNSPAPIILPPSPVPPPPGLPPVQPTHPALVRPRVTPIPKSTPEKASADDNTGD